MSSMSNVSYTNQSMNGIITLSDGMGTTIENGTITTNTLTLKSNLEMEIDFISTAVNIVGFTPIDGNVYLYDTINSVAVNMVDGVVGTPYKLLLPIDEFDCIFIGLSNANITSCGLWVGAYNSILNPTSVGSFNSITIGIFNYIIFSYTFTLTTTETLLYLYALDNNYINPFTPLTLYVSISLTGVSVIEIVELLELKALQGITGNIQLQLNQISQPLYGNILVLQGNIVDTTTQINNLYGNVSVVQSQIPPLYGNVLVLQSNIVNTTTQINNLYGNVSVVQSRIPPIYGNVLVLQGNIVSTTTQINNLYGNVSVVQSQIPPLYGNVLVLQGNIVNTTTQINNLYGNVSVVQSQIPPLYSNVLVQQTKTTAISYIPTTTTISSNVVVSGFLDVSNCLVQNNAGIGYSLGIGGNLAVGTDIVNSGNIVCGKTMFSNTINTQNLVLNSQVIQSDTQAQITYIYNNLFQPLWRPLFNTINPLNLVLYYPFTSTLYFNSNTVIGLNVGNLATGTIVYDASLSGLTNIVNNKLSSLHTAQPPAGQHGLVINRSVSIPSGATDGCSFSFWFICTSLPSSTYWFLTTLQSSGGTRFFITIDPTNKININASTITSQNTVIVGNIYHVAVVMNTDPPTSNAITKMYINGVLQITTGGITYPSFTNTSGFNSIARDPLGNGLIGTIDDYRLYTRPITALEVSTLYSLSPYI